MDAPQSTTLRKAYKYRIYPTVAQAKALDFHFGAVRYVYNRYRAAREGYYHDTGETLTAADCCLDLTNHKREAGYEWLQDAYLQSLQQAIRDLDRAYRNFFTGRSRYPRFKSKRGRQAMRYLFAGGKKMRIANGRHQDPEGWERESSTAPAHRRDTEEHDRIENQERQVLRVDSVRNDNDAPACNRPRSRHRLGFESVRNIPRWTDHRPAAAPAESRAPVETPAAPTVS